MFRVPPGEEYELATYERAETLLARYNGHITQPKYKGGEFNIYKIKKGVKLTIKVLYSLHILF